MTFYCNGKPLGMVDDVELEDAELEGFDIAHAKVWKDETFTAEVDTSGWSKEHWQAIFGLIPIIRCKNCLNWMPGYITDQDDFIPPKCGKYQQMVGHSSDDYCSLAERKDND